jgi:serine-aspartate repeat-containing protein C/D/E
MKLNTSKVRRSILESLESRTMFNVDPIWIGGVYIEEDAGSDLHGDSLFVQFKGGAPNTKLTKLVINTDQGLPGFSQGDNLFDTIKGGRGADEAFAFQIVGEDGRFSNANVGVELSDGGMLLTLTFDNFRSTDRLKISVDVDEVQFLSDPNNIPVFNSDLDPITSGAEFARSKLTAYFSAPHYEDAIANTVYRNEYDQEFVGSGLTLPRDNDGGLRDRTAGTATSIVQTPKPISLSGTVYVDNNLNLIQEIAENGIPNVTLELFRLQNGNYVTTGHTTTTNLLGQYEFGISLGLQPGTYQVREVQPNGYVSVGAVSGLLNGNELGKTVSGNKNVLTGISFPLGDSHGTRLDFAEAQPVQIRGFVYSDLDDDGVRDNGENGIGGIEVQIVSIETTSGTINQTIRTNSDGSYRFEGLPPGRYQVIQREQPVGYLDGKDTPGTIHGQTRGRSTVNDQITDIELRGAEQGVEYNFGEILPASVSGHVYHDANDDGIFQSTETGISNVIIRLEGSNGVSEIRTDSLGRYRFDGLTPGAYRITEVTPTGYLDGKDRVGTISGSVVGVIDGNDAIRSIVLNAGNSGVDYNFGELLPSSLSGHVYEDADGDCIRDPQEDPIANVLIELLNENGVVIETTRTDSEGRYQFDNLRPGTYAIRETQPDGYFQGGQMAPPGVGLTDQADLIREIRLSSGQSISQLDFCEVPPAIISGYVFQDGDEILTQNGQPPESLLGIRDGVRDATDKPISGVVLELRTRTGLRIPSLNALPGIYQTESLRVTTDENGYYEFRGLRSGAFHVYQVQPNGYFDGRDTPGSSFGSFAINVDDAGDQNQLGIIELLAIDPSTNPGSDAILMINLESGGRSIENNFSEIIVAALPPDEPRTPAPPPESPRPPITPAPENGYVSINFDRMLVLPPIVAKTPDAPLYAYVEEYTWHLSVINAGEPRGPLTGKRVSRERVKASAVVLNPTHWTIDTMDRGQWTVVSTTKTKIAKLTRDAFDIAGAKQMAGDFNGDGTDELGLFKDGEWLLDINGDGVWDEGDLWASLGKRGDEPIIGDWDGDGKDDIGIFGPEWDGDEDALMREPGLPDPENRQVPRPKNVPRGDLRIQQGRLMQRSLNGSPRSDVIDHVFRFGGDVDQPVAGDFNGDGVSTLGIFSNGSWRLDVNGDGVFTEAVDSYFEFGKPGDIAVVGDFNGDGLDEVAVVRGGDLIVDSNGNGAWDATDSVFKIEGEGSNVVVGDFDGDGIDEAAFYANFPIRDSIETRTASRPL